jgi:hypothetical protein
MCFCDGPNTYVFGLSANWLSRGSFTWLLATRIPDMPDAMLISEE